jgi:membrane protease YdiL (CAAX protease family)
LGKIYILGFYWIYSFVVRGPVKSEAMFDPVSVPIEAPPRILPADRLGALAEVVLCSGVPTQLVISAAMTIVGMRLETSGGGLSPLFVATLSLLDTALVIGLVVMFLRAHRERTRDVLLGQRPVWREAIAGVALLPVVFLLALLTLGVLITFAPELHNVPRNPMEDLMQTRRDAAIFGIVVMIAGGVREEIQRGFILHRFRHYLGGGAVGVIVHSTVFGLEHFLQGWDAALTVGALGALWGTIYLMRGSVIAPMVSHAGFNLAQLLKLMALR